MAGVRAPPLNAAVKLSLNSRDTAFSARAAGVIGTSLACQCHRGLLENGLSAAGQSRMVQESGRQHPGSHPPMNDAARRVQTTYLILLLLHTLAASFIWGINTLFLLDAGLSNTEAFAANAFFTAGMVIFEVPTGVARRHARPPDVLSARHDHARVRPPCSICCCGASRRRSAAWAVASALLGLGFTFFSGAVEAWLVDALTFTGYLRDRAARLEDGVRQR